MDAFIKRLAKMYFDHHAHEFGTNAVFEGLTLASAGDSDVPETDFVGVAGQIAYSQPDDGTGSGRSKPILVKYFQSSSNETPIFEMFVAEWFFYRVIEPIFSSWRSMKHLVLSYYVGQHRTTSSNADMTAMIFAYPDNVVLPAYADFVAYSRLLLMARKIGQFHAYSLAARAENTFDFVVALYPAYGVGHHEAIIRATLLRCLQPLLQHPKYAAGARRLERMIGKFSDHLTVSLPEGRSAANECCLLCHRCYHQGNVLFEYRNGTAVDMKIVNWQRIGWASLGVDLVIMLFADADPHTRCAHWDQLLTEYYFSLTLSTLGEQHVVPSMDRVLQEIKASMPVALYVLACRVNYLHLKANSEAVVVSSTLWNDALITKVYKEIILDNFV